MMRDEVFVDLNRRDPRLSLVRYPRLAADAHDRVVVLHAVDELRH